MADAKDLKLSPIGLWTAPSAVEAPRGALRQADNIVIRRKGIAEPRPGFGATTYNYLTQADRLAAYGSYILGWQNSPNKLVGGTGTEIKDESATALVWDRFGSCENRGNLYLTTKDGVRKITNPNAATAYRTAAPVPFLAVGVVENAGNALQAGNEASYRALCRRTDANGVVVRSAPSGRIVARNTTGFTCYVSLFARLHPSAGFLAGDVIEFYRSQQIDSTPPDEHFLVASYTLTSTDITFHYVAFTDNAPDSALGAALYTNDDQEGIEGANLALPYAQAAEYFNGSLFLANLTYRHRLVISYLATPVSAGGTIGQRAFSATFTGGTNTATVTAGLLSLKVGMLIYDPAALTFGTNYWTRITGISGSTLTLERNATSSGTHTHTAADCLQIDSQYFPAYHPATLVSAINGWHYTGDISTVATASTSVSAFGIGELAAVATGLGFPDTTVNIFLESFSPQQTAPTVRATNGAAYDPALPEIDTSVDANPYTMAREIDTNGVAWSKNSQPEHFTTVNIDRAGQSGTVRALKNCGNALLVFKDDGLWRISGAGADSGFRFDEMDKDVRILTPDTACRIANKVYALCDKGAAECDENGAITVSAAIYDQLDPLVRASVGTTSLAWWMVPNRKSDEFIMHVPAVTGVAAAAATYVFNRLSGAWTTWSFDTAVSHGTYSDNNSLLYFATTGDQLLRSERLLSTSLDAYNCDRSYSFTATRGSGTSYTITSGSWVPAVADLVYAGSAFFVVTAAADATHITLDADAGASLTATALIPPTATIAPIAGFGSGPGDLKVWGEGSLWFEDIYGLLQCGLAFTSSASPANSVGGTKTLAATRPGHGPESFRFTAPRAHARCTQLRPVLTIRQGGALWALSCMALGYYWASARVRNRGK